MHQSTSIWRDLSVGSMFLSVFFKCIPGLLRYCDRYIVLGDAGCPINASILFQTGRFQQSLGLSDRSNGRQAAGVGGADNQAESQLIHPRINHTSCGFGKAVASASKQNLVISDCATVHLTSTKHRVVSSTGSLLRQPFTGTTRGSRAFSGKPRLMAHTTKCSSRPMKGT